MVSRVPRILVLATVILAVAGGAAGADRYDPRLRFRTLTTPHFSIHFHQGEEVLARRLAVLAEQVRREMEPGLGRPQGRVHVILVDQDDTPNGWATPFPYNVIEITAAAPRGSSVIGNTRDWLRLVFVHEYTHILHLDRSRGPFAAGRRLFGRHPVALPNIFTPPWQIEGIATYYESVQTGEGRVPAADFRLLLDRAARSGRFASLDRASSDTIGWPAGTTPYLYGAYFHRYLADTYGEASLSRLADRTAGRVPYLGSAAFETVFGKSLGALWTDFESHATSVAMTTASTATRLTHHGFVVSSPIHGRDGRLFYAVSDPHGFPSIRERLPDGASREIATRIGGSSLAATPDGTVVFDGLDFVRSVGLQSDLYEVVPETGAVHRLTQEARAGDPAISPDGRTFVVTIQEADRRSLATLSRGASAPAPLVSAPDTHFASPRWSPDGRTIAAERRVRGGQSEVVLVDAATGAVRDLVPLGGRGITPAWTPDGRGLLVASDAGGVAFQIHHVELDSGAVRRLVNAGDLARAPVLSPDGRTLTYVGYTAEGYDLFALPWTDAVWEPVVPEPTTSSEPAPFEPVGAVVEGTYRPAPMLLPRFWTPIIEPDGDELSLGAATGSADALGRHAYAAGVAWASRARPDWYAAYSYDRWRPTLFLTASDDTDPWRDGTVRDLEVNAGASLAFRTVRRTQALFAATHLSTDSAECAECAPAVDATVRRFALRGGWTFNSSRRYGYSISREHGLLISTGGEWSPPVRGSAGDARTLVMDARAFLPAAPRHGVIAFRSAVAASWGDDTAVRAFGVGGSGRGAGVSFGRDAIGIVRGFDTDAATGRRALVVNADYRVPLAWIEHGVGTWPAFVRSVHGAVFADAGAAWTRRLVRDDVRISTGVELSADVVVGYVVPLTVTAGAAWRHDRTRAAGGVALFARIGHAF